MKAVRIHAAPDARDVSPSFGPGSGTSAEVRDREEDGSRVRALRRPAGCATYAPVDRLPPSFR